MHDGSSDYARNGRTSLFPAFYLLSSSWILISPFSQSASHPASRSSLRQVFLVLFTSSCASCISSTRRRKSIHEDRHASILAKNRNNNKKSYPKTHLLNPLPSILTTIQLLGASASHSSNLRTYSNLYRFNQIHVHSWFFVWNGTYSLLAIVAKDFQRL